MQPTARQFVEAFASYLLLNVRGIFVLQKENWLFTQFVSNDMSYRDIQKETASIYEQCDLSWKRIF